MQSRSKIIGVIPARLDSSRLPGKVLRKIGDKAMLERVYDRARSSPLLSELVVASDSEEILQFCAHRKIPSVETRPHKSGSDRLYEVLQRTDGKFYLNIQGDEPTLRKDHIDRLLRPLLAGRSSIVTLKAGIDPAAARDPNCVKVVTDKKGRALYFSRLPIPYNRDGREDIRYYKHIGLYGYTRSALELFHKLPPSKLEQAEKLEQLRLLENGAEILVEETPYDTIGVDT
ncbi:MAG: 3-deoxy-manno-octulosonate cytidylyltransferase, partial [Acidobacteria bacterium]|nr:3-deoxy-manno-octulosonate cytidylyltransferase [Acidobacteriota bacterium]